MFIQQKFSNVGLMHLSTNRSLSPWNGNIALSPPSHTLCIGQSIICEWSLTHNTTCFFYGFSGSLVGVLLLHTNASVSHFKREISCLKNQDFFLFERAASQHHAHSLTSYYERATVTDGLSMYLCMYLCAYVCIPLAPTVLVRSAWTFHGTLGVS